MLPLFPLAQTATQAVTQPATSAISHTFTGYSVGKEAIIVALLGFLCPLLGLFILARTARLYARKDPSQLSSTALTFLLPVLFTVVSSWSDVLKPVTWDKNPGENMLWPVSACSIMTGLLVWLKLLEGAAKPIITGSVSAMRVRRDAAIYAVELFTSVVAEKLKRLNEIRKGIPGSRLSRTQYLEGIDPKAQLALLLKVAHRHFEAQLPHRRDKLRLALYRRSEDRTRLERLFAWDGTRDTCYSDRWREYLRLQPNQISELVRAFNGIEDLVIHQNCYRSMQTRDYRELHVDHRKTHKSLLIYRHTLPEDSAHGAMLLQMDTDESDFFQESEAAVYTEFFSALMQRVEYEYLTLDALAPQP